MKQRRNKTKANLNLRSSESAQISVSKVQTNVVFEYN